MLEDIHKVGIVMELSYFLNNRLSGKEITVLQDLRSNGWIRSGPILPDGSSEESAFSTSYMKKFTVERDETEV